jgi:hypothetical protein
MFTQRLRKSHIKYVNFLRENFMCIFTSRRLTNWKNGSCCLSIVFACNAHGDNKKIQACAVVFIVKQWSRKNNGKTKLIKSWQQTKRPGERTMLTTTLRRRFRIGYKNKNKQKTRRRKNLIVCGSSVEFTASTQTERPAGQTSTGWQQRQSCKWLERTSPRRRCSP